MQDIAIYGAGGFGREVYCLIQLINDAKPQWNFIGFFDDGKPKGGHNEYGEYLGGMDDLNSWTKPLNVVFALGNPLTLNILVSKVCNEKISYPNIIAPDLFLTDQKSFKIGKGNIIQRNTSISCNVTIGDFNVFNGGNVLGHDVEIGNCNALMPGSRISGAVKIGNRNMIGVMSCVIQTLHIGDEVTLGAGSALMTKPKNGGTYIGVPAKLFKF